MPYKVQKSRYVYVWDFFDNFFFWLMWINCWITAFTSFWARLINVWHGGKNQTLPITKTKSIKDDKTIYFCHGRGNVMNIFTSIKHFFFNIAGIKSYKACSLTAFQLDSIKPKYLQIKKIIKWEILKL